MADNTPSIIIVKKVVKGGGGHHGGAWKVAYADFVTAMMAFFLLLWLLNAVTEDQLQGIANYFAPVTVSDSPTGSGGVLGGQTITKDGTMKHMGAPPMMAIDLPPVSAGEGESEDEKSAEGGDEEESDSKEVEAKDSETEEERQAKEAEDKQFEEAKDSLRKAVNSVPQLKQLADSLIVDNTAEGLRIQIVDQEGLAMFPRGSAGMYDHTRKVLELVAKVVSEMPQKLVISGYTDATKYVTKRGYGNWELSADRANASRRALLELGVPEDRFSRVVGKAATDPLLPDDPTNPRNRRLSLVLLRGSGHAPPAPVPASTPVPASVPAQAPVKASPAAEKRAELRPTGG